MAMESKIGQLKAKLAAKEKEIETWKASLKAAIHAYNERIAELEAALLGAERAIKTQETIIENLKDGN